jgi:hypothetical protein
MSEPKSHWWNRDGFDRKREYAEPLPTETWEERQVRLEALAEFRRGVLVLNNFDKALLRGMKIEC